MTDLVQGILTIVLSFILVPFALNKAGGFTGLHDVIGHEFADKNMFSLPTPGEILAGMSDNTVGGEKYDNEWPERAHASLW